MLASTKNVVFGAIALSLSFPVFAADRAQPEDAIAHVNRMIDYVKKNGEEKAFAEFNNTEGPFNVKSDINKYGDLYALVYKQDGVQPVHGKNKKIPGNNVMDMRDADGVYLIREMIKVCQSKEGKGWVSYKWPHSITKAIESKKTYIVKHGEYCYGSGVYAN